MNARTVNELNGFLAIARGSAGEVRSMIAVVRSRPRLKPYLPRLLQIRELAESCARQITAWALSNESSPVQGKRHLTPEIGQRRQVAQNARDFRLNFLRTLSPQHPLYNSPEARAARGEPDKEEWVSR